jgi:hypothetical protein
VPRELSGNGSPRWKQRAFYDFVTDRSPLPIGVTVVRVAVWDTLVDAGRSKRVEETLLMLIRQSAPISSRGASSVALVAFLEGTSGRLTPLTSRTCRICSKARISAIHSSLTFGRFHTRSESDQSCREASALNYRFSSICASAPATILWAPITATPRDALIRLRSLG